MKNVIKRISVVAILSLLFCVVWHSLMFVWSEIKGEEVQALKYMLKAIWAVSLILLLDVLDKDPL